MHWSPLFCHNGTYGPLLAMTAVPPDNFSPEFAQYHPVICWNSWFPNDHIVEILPSCPYYAVPLSQDMFPFSPHPPRPPHPPARYLHIGVKCRDWSESPWLAIMIERYYCCWSLSCAGKALSLLTISVPNPAGPHAKACAT